MQQIELRIHHFFDILRDFGKKNFSKEIAPHPYGHSFHKIAQLIKHNPDIKIRIIVGCDSICKGCKYKKNESCIDKISHRKEFEYKEEFNNYLDKRILQKCGIKENEITTPRSLCKKAKLYLDNFDFIYSGNENLHNIQRKKDVIKGLNYYLDLHKIEIKDRKLLLFENYLVAE